MKLICISGSSGVGKTTVSKLIQSILGTKECLCLSGDDLHRWERNDPMWKIKTHLDPQSNDLEMGYGHLLELSNGNSINRKIYNHDTGKFDSAAMISPRPWVVYEGLHALSHRPTADMATLKIFVDTDETLKTEWKIKRDTKKRGYTEKQVVEMMKRRKIDEDRFITVQKKEADIVIKFTRNRNASISLDYVSVNGRGVELLETVKEFYDSMMDFMSICKWLSLDPALVQGRGGNVSVKSDSGLLIKASGAKMADVNLHHGFCVCNFNKSIPNEFQTEDEYTDWVRSSNKTGEYRPSMETGFHALLADRVVIHTHPIHLNAILCSKEGKSLIANLFSDMTYEYVEYVKPGSCLMSKISTDKSVFFLENHGLIVTAKDAQEAFETTERINSRCKRWLSNHVESFVDTEENETGNSPLFPDAAVFPNEMQSINNYILGLMTGACLTPKFLNADEIESLNNMPSEKYRKALV
jgi:uridine kinase/ribulose-5-phosphate 4-epimerase/fuculose-1-phosphate aldolase